MLKMLNNGNLILYDKLLRPLWSSHTFMAGGYVAMQNDGNLVIYNANNKPYWSSRKLVEWKKEPHNNWAFRCEFKGQDLTNMRSRGEQCSSLCRNTKNCTHYSWNMHSQGTCWLKTGPVTKNDLFYTNNPSDFCGFIF